VLAREKQQSERGTLLVLTDFLVEHRHTIKLVEEGGTASAPKRTMAATMKQNPMNMNILALAISFSAKNYFMIKTISKHIF
jgi:hypothetical protein